MSAVRLVITVFILTIVVLSAYGFSWWGNPPAPLASYATGGRVILSLLMLLAIGGLIRLWSPASPSHAR